MLSKTMTWSLAGSAAALLLTTPAVAEVAADEEQNQTRGPTTAGPDGPPPDARGSGRGGPPPGIDTSDIVFDDTWVTLGIGAGLVPSYSGSDDYVFFPLPLIVGRVGGVGISPNGPGVNLDLLSQAPEAGPPSESSDAPSFAFGPSIRFRNDRADQIEDEVVKAAGELETALEIGANAGVTFSSVLNRFDRVTLSTSVRWDILGAHDGMVVEPSVGYFTPMGKGSALQLAFSAQIIDDNFADYYYSVSPQQSADSGLPEFTADGGLNSLGLTAIGTYDLDGNLMNGGWNIYAIGGYSRLVGDSANTPFTSERGSANQFLGGIGVGYTF